MGDGRFHLNLRDSDYSRRLGIDCTSANDTSWTIVLPYKLHIFVLNSGISKCNHQHHNTVIICIARASRELFPRFYILFSILLQFESSVVIVSSWSKVFLSFLTLFASFLILQIQVPVHCRQYLHQLYWELVNCSVTEFTYTVGRFFTLLWTYMINFVFTALFQSRHTIP